ncbi:MAG: FliO/MopB family protein [Phycisphaerales bacterium]|nr:FliO/MopB family protein [Phycisphaerales bacterium]
MESTKRFAITFIATVTVLTLPALADNQSRANTPVELSEHVQAAATLDEQQFVDADSGEIRYAIKQADEGQVEADIDATIETVPSQLEYEGADEAVENGVLSGMGEDAVIPRRVSHQSSEEIVRAGQASVPWYRSPFIALVVVLGVIAAVATGVRRWVPAARSVSSDQLRVVGRTAISSKQSAVLLHVGKRVVLLGVTSDRVNTLAEITDESEVAQLVGQAKSAESKASGFDTSGIDSIGIKSSEFDAALAREFEQYEESEANTQTTKANSQPTEVATHPEVEVALPQDVVEVSETPEPIEAPVASEPVTAEAKKSNGQPPKHLNDLLARLRSFQKS